MGRLIECKYFNRPMRVHRAVFLFSLDNYCILWYSYYVIYCNKDCERDSSAGEMLPQRVGDGVSPTEYRCVKITRELPAEWVRPLSADGVPPLEGRRMMVRAIGGIARFDSRPVLRGGGFFIFRRLLRCTKKYRPI